MRSERCSRGNPACDDLIQDSQSSIESKDWPSSTLVFAFVGTPSRNFVGIPLRNPSTTSPDESSSHTLALAPKSSNSSRLPDSKWSVMTRS